MKFLMEQSSFLPEQHNTKNIIKKPNPDLFHFIRAISIIHALKNYYVWES
jgi:hypothetical protein